MPRIPAIEWLPRRQSKSSITYICVNEFLRYRYGAGTVQYYSTILLQSYILTVRYRSVPYHKVPPRARSLFIIRYRTAPYRVIRCQVHFIEPINVQDFSLHNPMQTIVMDQVCRSVGHRVQYGTGTVPYRNGTVLAGRNRCRWRVHGSFYCYR